LHTPGSDIHSSDLASWLAGLKRLAARRHARRRNQQIAAHWDLLPFGWISACADPAPLIEMERVCERLQLKPPRGRRAGSKWEAVNVLRMNRLAVLRAATAPAPDRNATDALPSTAPHGATPMTDANTSDTGDDADPPPATPAAGAPMSNQQAAEILAKLHLGLRKTGERVQRKRSLKPSEPAMWLADLRQQRIALAVAFKALTGRDLTRG
jgi:hypothetical protein